MLNARLFPNCYVRITATGKVGRVTNKYRDGGKILYGVAWSGEFTPSALQRISPAEYHATNDSLKITNYESGL